MPDEDLIKRLRDAADSAADDDTAELFRQAANALEDINQTLESVMEGAKRLMRHGSGRKT
jgi:DNA-binding ferritin-like protein